MRRIWKLLALNVGIVALALVLFSERLIGLQFSTGSVVQRAFSVLLAVLLVGAAVYFNWKWMPMAGRKSKNDEEELPAAAADRIKDLEMYMGLFENLLREKPFLQNLVHEASLQIGQYHEKEAALERILKRNRADWPAVYEGMEAAERAIAANLHVVLNGAEMYTERDSEAVIQRDPLIKEAFQANASIFEQIDGLLNQARRTKGSARVLQSSEELERTIKVLETLNKQYYSGEFERKSGLS